jgi:hypothetical protein
LAYRDAVPDAEWWICPMEPMVKHRVPVVPEGDVPRPALCQVESPAWRPVQDTDGLSRPCPLCAAADVDVPRWRARSDEHAQAWGQPGDVRGL